MRAVRPARRSATPSSTELMLEVIDGLQAAGVKTKDIIVFERYRDEFLEAGWQKDLPDGIAWTGLGIAYNGKQVDMAGQLLTFGTSPVLWGEPGTNGQHAYFQMLHQGPTIVPIDFVAVLTPEHPLVSHHPKLLANCFAQSEALMLRARSVWESMGFLKTIKPPRIGAALF